ncbi:MAG: hypothetical protein KIIPBIDF_01885 [Candidatus Methanoperedenaceae archaeon GB50]|nr:MAG: hypothetical protein KIIPBIDF_01885 [Candidatus Methanoperedenaceae archaeon GB50]
MLKFKKTGVIKMGKTLTQKILEAHLVSGKYKPGEEIAIAIDQTLTHGLKL